ncbi:MAG TPA: dihydrodipicolinate synthase family protein, partial [Terriglobales bacterium]
MLLHGIFPPITTPFYPDGRVYLKKLEHNVERYSKTPVAGIVVLGSTGEAVMLSDEERAEVLKAARESCSPSKVLIAGTGTESAIETLRTTEYAAALGYDLALVRTPFFYRKQMQPANILAFYRMVADRSPIPILIYSVPPFTQYDIPAELVAELAAHPNIIGIKESSGDVEKVRRMVESTRHIKRTATVTTTFAAVTPRMLKSDSQPTNGSGGLVSVAALAGESSSQSEAERGASRPSSSSSSVSIADVPSGLKTRQKDVGFQVLVGAAQKLYPSLEAGAIGGILAFACPAP